jgi:Fasciclin domain
MQEISIFQELFKQTALPSSYSIFVPDNSAFEVLHPAELSYLRTSFGKQDRTHLVHRHASNNITYLKNLANGGSIPSLEGERLHYKQREKDIFVDGANITQPDIVARNGPSPSPPHSFYLPRWNPRFRRVHILIVGVVHVISKLLLPDSVIFTPLKYLFGLGNIIFAEILAASDSFSLANDSSISQTILAPVDSAYVESIDMKDTELLKQVQYNFLDQEIDFEEVEDGELLRTKYDLKSLDGGFQRIKLTRMDGKVFLNNGIEVIPESGTPPLSPAIPSPKTHANSSSPRGEYNNLLHQRRTHASWPTPSNLLPRLRPLPLIPPHRLHEPRPTNSLR